MRRHAIVVAAAVLLCFPPLARAQRDQVSPANKEALGLAEQLSGGYADAVNAHDAAKAAAFYAPDGEPSTKRNLRLKESGKLENLLVLANNRGTSQPSLIRRQEVFE
jgi:hypothetical protein